MAGWWSSKPFDEFIARATSESLPSGTEDLFLNLEVADQIRSKSVAPKEAMRALKRRINHKNPNVQLAALKLTDTCVKNGGDHFLIEVASREFMDNLVSLLKAPSGVNLDVKNEVLEDIQTWTLAFEGRPHLSYVKATFAKLKSEGFQFPDVGPVTASFVDSSAPPEWADSDSCMRCHTPFTLTNRKHHCRNCGNVYCGDCSSKTIPLPHLGIVQPVRVCETCYEERNLKLAKSASATAGTSPAPAVKPTRLMQPRNARIEDDDDKDLKMALQMSLEESKRHSHPLPSAVPQPESAQSAVQPPNPTRNTEDAEDEDLKAAIAASLKDMEVKKAIEYPNVPATPRAPVVNPSIGQFQAPSGELSALEAENITLFATLIERMQSSPPGAILREPRIQELYEAVSALKPKLGRTLSTVVGTYESLVDMHAKLNTVVRYYDKMLEDRLATTYSHATYQETRLPSHNSQAYQYQPPPQSPASPSQVRQDYFPSRHSTFSDPVPQHPAAQVPQESPAMYSSPQNSAYSQPPQWGYSGYLPPSVTPAVSKAPMPQSYQTHVPYHHVQPSTTTDQQLPNQYYQPADQNSLASVERQSSHPLNGENYGYHQQPHPQPVTQRKEESSLIDL